MVPAAQHRRCCHNDCVLEAEGFLLCRIRPSDINKSFAFPSGHTTSAVFILGTLLFVILPLCVAGWTPSATFL